MLKAASLVSALIIATSAHGFERAALANDLGTSGQSVEMASVDDVPLQPFERGALGIELAGAFFGEAWNLNGRREWLLDGSASMWWTFVSRASLVLEFHGTTVFQAPSRNAFVIGVAPLLRWQVHAREPWKIFVELGPGFSWSDTRVPPRGTRFNYLAVAGIGFMRRLGRQSHAIAGFRWLHVSNDGLEGISRNPDIEALGGYAGVSVAF